MLEKRAGVVMKNTQESLLEAVIVTGGAGYIGSHTAWALAQAGFKIIIIDDFSQHQRVDLPWAEIIHGDFGDVALLRSLFAQYCIVAVFHFAAFIEVGESVIRPRDFYQNNLCKTINLLNTMLDHDVKTFVFSSTCALYGKPQYMPMDELHPFNPISPYGRTKLAVEFVLQDYARAYGLLYASLRYFNASGAQYELGLGEQHTPETHLIPRVLHAITHDEPVYIFGTDYETPDGSCLRDYIHVRDLAKAHLLAFKKIEETNQPLVINAGSGVGYSVREVIKQAEIICEKKALVKEVAARPGDAPSLIADITRMKKILGWQPEYSDLNSILRSAYAWQIISTEKKYKELEIKQVEQTMS